MNCLHLERMAVKFKNPGFSDQTHALFFSCVQTCVIILCVQETVPQCVYAVPPPAQLFDIVSVCVRKEEEEEEVRDSTYKWGCHDMLIVMY
jgi:hypothetical protein